MTPKRGRDWYDVVRAHWRRTTGYLLAGRDPCIAIRDDEIAAVKGRVLVGRVIDDLVAWTPPDSWLLGVLLCPGDTVDPLVEWMGATSADPTRVWFYLHPDVHHRILTPWEDAGFEADQVDVVATWQELHKLFGLALNDRVYADWNDAAIPRRRPAR